MAAIQTSWHLKLWYDSGYSGRPVSEVWPIKMRDSADAMGLMAYGCQWRYESRRHWWPDDRIWCGITSWKDGGEFDGALILDDHIKTPMTPRSEAVRESINHRLSCILHSRRNHRRVPMVIVTQRPACADP